MGDYGLGLNSNVRALSPVDFNQLTNNQSLFSPEPIPHNSNNHHQNYTMQDETLVDKNGVKQHQISSNNTDNSSDQNHDVDINRKSKNDGSSPSFDDKKNVDAVSSVTTSLSQLGLSSDPNGAVISSLASAPNFWSTATADDTFIQGFPVNGTVTFQNFPPAHNQLYNSNMAPQIGISMAQQQPPPQTQRRAITAHHNFPQSQRQQQNMYLNNKSYPQWSSAPQQQQSSWSQQTQNTLSPWANIQQQQRRSVPNLNPIGAPMKKPPTHHPMNSSMMISPSKFRRSTSYPGHLQAAIGTKPGLDIAGLDDHRDANSMLNFHQVRTCFNSQVTCT